MKPVIACTIGDANGIGPEVLLKAITAPSLSSRMTPLLIGPPESFEFYVKRFGLRLRLEEILPSAHSVPAELWKSGRIPVIRNFDGCGSTVRPGTLHRSSGRVAASAIITATALVRAGLAHALVTAPVSKQALHMAGALVPGQTELLQKLTGSPTVAMMLVDHGMRVGLVTIHVPLRKVPSLLTTHLLRERITTIRQALLSDWRIKEPRIAVLGLNPHAGEQGDIGSEDKAIIKPTIAYFRRKGWEMSGPHPADAFFARYNPRAQDAVVAMYHDQGLIPLKMHAAGGGVNVTVGLPIVRTSPDHGTAFDIAGEGIADPTSTIEAIRLAERIIKNRWKID